MSQSIFDTGYLSEQLNIEHELELFVQDGMLHLKPTQQLRKGWFDDYDSAQDDFPLAEMKEIASEQEAWNW